MTGSIVVATDFSTRSDRALRRATIIAKQLGAALTLIHVVDDDRPRHLVDEQIDAAQQILDETTDTIIQMDGISAESKVIAGDVFSGILQVAQNTAASMIIVGPHRRQLRDAFIGTTAERTIAHSRCPVLMTAGVPSAPYDRILIALDVTEDSKAMARRTQDLGLLDKAAIVAMHAFDAPAQGMMQRAMVESEAVHQYVADEQIRSQEELSAILAEIGLATARKIMMPVNGSAARRILECARDENASLIVVGTSQRTGLRRFILGSVAEAVLADTDRDVLVIPKP
jgi:nucleotide-binding universal stress UspA family protein